MRLYVLIAMGLCLSACGAGSDKQGDSTASQGATIAASSTVSYSVVGQGPTTLIQVIDLLNSNLKSLLTVSYTIEPRAGSTSKPVHVSYSLSALKNRGYVIAPDEMHLPIFGLYGDYSNTVTLTLTYADESANTLTASITTPPDAEDALFFDSAPILQPRLAGSQLGFDFFVLKNQVGGPVIIDTDGHVRWIGTGAESAFSSIFQDNGFYVGSETSTQLNRVELDGSVTTSNPTAPGYVQFQHNFDPGPRGILTEVDTTEGAGSTVAELDPLHGFGNEWNMARIISNFMTANGDDPTAFVRQAVDWFHLNSVAYRASDNTLVVSSRENFLMGIDYDSGAIKWILGDPTKYWATFPSLLSKALTLQGSDDYPIGQHSVSITKDDQILVFNDGLGSIEQPSGASAGETRTYSAVSAYQIDTQAMTATEVWNFDYNKSIYSSICSSTYEVPDGSVLIDYASAENATHSRLVGLDNQHQVIFDFQYYGTACSAGWNAIPVPLDNISFDQ